VRLLPLFDAHKNTGIFQWMAGVRMSEGKAGDRDPPGTEAEILQAVAETLRGQNAAFRVIVERYEPVVRRLAVSFLRSHEDAEEAAQEIFLRAFRSLRTFRIERPFLPWLYAIALNHLRTRYAARKKTDRRFAEKNRDLTIDPGSDPPNLLDGAHDRARLRLAVAELPPGIREVVVLHYFEDKGVTQIASLLGIGSENAKSRLHRGRKLLRKKLGGDAT
jgi:RNA polymerase sigma-70 factor, ECF subfamily